MAYFNKIQRDPCILCVKYHNGLVLNLLIGLSKILVHICKQWIRMQIHTPLLNL